MGLSLSGTNGLDYGTQHYGGLTSLVFVVALRLPADWQSSGGSKPFQTVLVSGTDGATSISLVSWALTLYPGAGAGANNAVFRVSQNASTESYANVTSFTLPVSTWLRFVGWWSSAEQALHISTGDSTTNGSPVSSMLTVGGDSDRGWKIGVGRNDSTSALHRGLYGEIGYVAVRANGGILDADDRDALLEGYDPQEVMVPSSFWDLDRGTAEDPAVDWWGSIDMSLVGSPSAAEGPGLIRITPSAAPVSPRAAPHVLRLYTGSQS